MKIKPENQLGLNFTQQIKDSFYKIHSEKYLDNHPEEYVKPYREQWLEILSDNGNKNLLFTKTSMEIANSIRVSKFEPNILKVKSEKKLTFLVDDSHFYRVMLKNDEIFALIIKKVPHESGMFYWSYDSLKIFPLKNLVHYPACPFNYIEDKYFSEFLKLLIFVEYSELEETILNPNQSFGTKKQGKYFNATTQPFIVVDSQWNKIIIRNEGFGVSGHLRFQPIGVGRAERKLIYISEYVKSGYVRGAKRELIDGEKENNHQSS